MIRTSYIASRASPDGQAVADRSDRAGLSRASRRAGPDLLGHSCSLAAQSPTQAVALVKILLIPSLRGGILSQPQLALGVPPEPGRHLFG